MVVDLEPTISVVLDEKPGNTYRHNERGQGDPRYDLRLEDRH